MAASLVVVIVVLIVLLAAGIPLGMWLGRRGRGSLRLQVPARLIRPGEVVEGMVQLESKRELGPGRLYASLVCTEEWWEWDTDADGDQTRNKKTREAYRHDLDVVTDLAVAAGGDQVFPFTLPTPQPDRGDSAESDSGFGRLLGALGDLTRRNSDFIWSVEARYDIPGLDLKADERIHLDGSP